MSIAHRSGDKHLNADARIPECEQCEVKHLFPKPRRNIKVVTDKSVAHTPLRQSKGRCEWVRTMNCNL